MAVLVLLVAASAYFSSSETAFSSLNRIRLKSQAQAGNKRASAALRLSEQYDTLLSTILIGNNIVNIAAAHLSFRGEEARERVLRFGVVFSNAGYMAIPLQKALLGEDGVFYGAAYVAVFNLVLWSYGVMAMSGDRKALSARRLLLNPGVIGLAAGLLLFFTGIRLPAFLEAPVGHLAALNTPLPMLIVGFYLADADLKSTVRDKRLIASMGLRLLAVPLLTLGLLYLCGMRGALLTACVIAASAPAAAATTMFATRYGQDARLSVNLVALSTLCSMLTMPLVVGAAKALGG